MRDVRRRVAASRPPVFRSPRALLHTALLVIPVWLLWLTPAMADQPAEPCSVAAEQGGTQFPADRLDIPTRCQIGAVVNDYTTAGLIGPVQTPITPQLYDYLLDHPVLIAALLARLGLGAYQFTPKESNRYWVNDGDGTQGLLTLVYQDQTSRIYHMDGYHEGHIFPMVRAKAAAFLRVLPVTTTDGYPAVQTSLSAYTKLDDPLLAGLVRVLRPLIGDAVTRKLSRGFHVTNQLGAIIAQDRDRVAREAAWLTWLPPEELQTLTALLQTVPQRSAPPPGATTTP